MGNQPYSHVPITLNSRDNRIHGNPSPHSGPSCLPFRGPQASRPPACTQPEQELCALEVKPTHDEFVLSVNVADLVESITDGFVFLDREFRYTYVNAAAERLLGRSREDILGLSQWDLFPDAEHSPAGIAMRRCMDERIVTEFENFYDRWQRWFHLRCFPAPQGGMTVYFREITEQKLAQQERARLELALDAAGMGTWEWDLPSGKVIWSHKLQSLSGMQPDEFGQTYDAGMSTVHTEDREHVEAAVKRSVNDGVAYEAEYRAVLPDGSERWILGRGRPMQDDFGRTVKLMGLAMDITERRRTEHLVQRLAAIVEAAPDFIATARYEDGRILYINAGGRRMLGLEDDADVSGLFHHELCPPWVMERTTREWLPKALASGSASGEGALLAVDGREIPVSFSLVVQRDARGSVETISTIAHDLTTRMSIDAARRESEQRLRLALEAGRLGAWDWDISSDVVIWSEGLEKLAGMAGSTRPRTFREFLAMIHPDDRTQVEAAVARSLANDTYYEVEFRVMTPSGIRWASRRGHVLRDAQGKPVRMLGVGADITDRKRAEEALLRSHAELQRANADLEQFAYSASHDLKEPLRMVSLYSQLLLRQYGESLDARAHEYLNFAIHGAKRMEQLVNDLLLYTKAGGLDLEPAAPIDASAVLSNVLTSLQSLMEESSATILASPLPLLPIRESHLTLLLQNLISNAIRYRGSEAPRIEIDTIPGGANLCHLRVRDNGLGIDPAYQEQIFGLFKRLHTNEEYPGTGLGLAICRKIVERYGGRIWVESPGLGMGSTFHVTLPAHGEA